MITENKTQMTTNAKCMNLNWIPIQKTQPWKTFLGTAGET